MSIFAPHLNRLLHRANTRADTIAQTSERARTDADIHAEHITEALKDTRGDPDTVRVIRSEAAAIVEARAALRRHLTEAQAEAESIKAHTRRIWDLILSDRKPPPWNR